MHKASNSSEKMALTKFMILLSIITLSFTLSLADNLLFEPISTSALCDDTPYPSFCKSVLPKNLFSNIYDSGRISFKISLSYAKALLSLVEKDISRAPSLSSSRVGALRDCKSLMEINLELLSSSYEVVKSRSMVLAYDQADDIQTKLSAVMTNAETCLDGIQETASARSLGDGFFVSLSNNKRLYSVVLAFFVKGWVPKNRPKTIPEPRNRKNLFWNGKLNLKMSKKHQDVINLGSLISIASSDRSDAVLVSDTVTVDQNKSSGANFTTINDAIAAAPTNSDGSSYFFIYVTAGVYHEYISIASNKTYILMVGDGIDQTVITGNRSVVDGWTTFNSPTFAVVARGFVGVGITFQNTAGAIKHQAVAVRNGADMSTFYICSFEGYQDTLYVHSQRQFYRECNIYGTVDFIFGNSASVFQNCNIYPRLPKKGQFNSITAQGRKALDQSTGILIQNCVITAAHDLALANFTVETYLGRPWKEYALTVYMQSFMDTLINPLGWHEWNGSFALTTLYYAEFFNWGPGSDTTGRVTWPGYHIIDVLEANDFTVSNFITGDCWLPQTGVPYYGGLFNL